MGGWRGRIVIVDEGKGGEGTRKGKWGGNIRLLGIKFRWDEYRLGMIRAGFSDLQPIDIFSLFPLFFFVLSSTLIPGSSISQDIQIARLQRVPGGLVRDGDCILFWVACGVVSRSLE